MVDRPSFEDLQFPEAIAAFVDNALQTGDAGKIADALGVAVHAKGLAIVAEKTGLSPEQLEASLCQGGDPTFSVTTAIMQALGIRFAVLRDDELDKPL